MRKLLLGISAAALSAGLAVAQDNGVNIEQITIMQAWEDEAPMKTPNSPEKPGELVFDEPGEVLKMEPTPPEIRKLKLDNENYNPNGQNAWVDQVGQDNDVRIDQDEAGAGAVADVVIRGDENLAEIRQRTNRSDAGAYAVITIYGPSPNVGGASGDPNEASIDQLDTGTDGNMADIQIGNDGSGEQVGVRSFGSNNRAGIVQRGNGHMADINIREDVGRNGGVTGSNADTNTAFIRQRNNGDERGNQARIDQVSDANMASIEQDGEGNLASIEQRGDLGERFGHMSRITQEGNDNQAKTIQLGDSNFEETYQLGDFNTAVTMQDGTENMSVTWQDGDDNMASTVQDGDFNSSTIFQTGDNHMAGVWQENDSNKAAVEQYNAGGAAPGNLALVYQDGNDMANVQQWGGGNVAVVSQGTVQP